MGSTRDFLSFPVDVHHREQERESLEGSVATLMSNKAAEDDASLRENGNMCKIIQANLHSSFFIFVYCKFFKVCLSYFKKFL